MHHSWCRKTREWRGKPSRKGPRSCWILEDGKWQTSFEEIAWVQRQCVPYDPFLHLQWQLSSHSLWNGSFLGSQCHRTRRKMCVPWDFWHLTTGGLSFPCVDYWQFVILKAQTYFQNLSLNVFVTWWISACITLCMFNNCHCPQYLIQSIPAPTNYPVFKLPLLPKAFSLIARILKNSLPWGQTDIYLKYTQMQPGNEVRNKHVLYQYLQLQHKRRGVYFCILYVSFRGVIIF